MDGRWSMVDEGWIVDDVGCWILDDWLEIVPVEDDVMS